VNPTDCFNKKNQTIDKNRISGLLECVEEVEEDDP